MGRQKIETKKVTLYMRRKSEAKKLARLQADGWQVLEKVKGEDLLGRDNGMVTYMLTRGPAEAAATPSPPDIPAGWHPDPGGQRLLRWWDGARWTEHTAPTPGA